MPSYTQEQLDAIQQINPSYDTCLLLSHTQLAAALYKSCAQLARAEHYMLALEHSPILEQGFLERIELYAEEARKWSFYLNDKLMNLTHGQRAGKLAQIVNQFANESEIERSLHPNQPTGLEQALSYLAHWCLLDPIRA